MRRECDIGSLFSASPPTTTQAKITLEEQGIRITDEAGTIRLTSDIISDIHSALRRVCGISQVNVFEAIDLILAEQTESLDENCNKELSEFLAGFNIRDKVGGVLR